MDIKNKYIWIKFIPVLGIIPCIIDTTPDGGRYEKLYVYYHIVVGGFLSLLF